MGLDMYLTKKIYVGAKYQHRNVQGEIEISAEGQDLEIDLKKVVEITEEVACWRKANQIHGWFVENVQYGKDDCEEYPVTYEDLIKLRNLCKIVVDEKRPDLMPPTEGFFFGSKEIDEYYYGILIETIEWLKDIHPKDYYYYRSSW